MITDSGQAKKIVLLSVFALLAINTYRGKLTTKDISFQKRLWGTGMVGLMLSIAADIAPTVAGPFALLVVAGSLTNGGDQAVQNLLGKLSPASSDQGVQVTPVAPGTKVRTSSTTLVVPLQNTTSPGLSPGTNP